jgi:adenosylcobinamide-phosphate synthase
MGRVIALCERQALRPKSADAQRLAGLVLAVSLPAAVFLLARSALAAAPPRLRPLAEVALLSTALSMRGLARAALAVQRELEAGDLPAARRCVGEVVGRDTDDLPPDEVARAAVETVAENTSDGVVAPMLYGLLLGAPGALAYKATNTLDSMLGHPDPPYTYLGWAPARLDDLANLVPARLTALAAALASGRPAATLRSAARYGPRTKSPNAGWAEAAFAGALGLTLGGTNRYGGVPREGPLLGEGRPPEPVDIERAVRLMRRSCAFLVSLALLVGGRRG